MFDRDKEEEVMEFLFAAERAINYVALFVVIIVAIIFASGVAQ